MLLDDDAAATAADATVIHAAATTTTMVDRALVATAAAAAATTAAAVIVEVSENFLSLQLLYILLMYLLLLHCRPVAVLKPLLILLSLLSRLLLHTAATAAAYAIATSRPCHLLKLMTPGQIILPPFGYTLGSACSSRVRFL